MMLATLVTWDCMIGNWSPKIRNGVVMDGIHDMGGMHGFGKVDPEKNEPVFHTAWEGWRSALNRAMGHGHLDHRPTRAASRRCCRASTRQACYKKAVRMKNLLAALGLVGGDELQTGHALPGKALKRKPAAADVPELLSRGSFSRPAQGPARFKAGDRVRTKNIHPATHTRLPRYARGKTGVIEAIRGCHVFPDTVAIGKGEDPQWLYTVLFEGRELWGDNADPSLKVSIEAFEPYLEPVTP